MQKNKNIISFRVLYILLTIIVFSCSSDKKKQQININSTKISHTEKTKNEVTKTINKLNNSKIISNFLNDINSLKDIKHPIKTFKTEVEMLSVKNINFTKDNLPIVLDEASKYKYLVILVENHTIVKIDDVKKCKQSGSWSACMPYGKGFIKKGNLIYTEDYINYIIGKPNSQKRIAYFFN